MRYQARKAPLFENKDGDVWEVIETIDGVRNRSITFLTSESKAKIIEFALNSIVDNKVLATTDGTYECETCQADTVTSIYDGPTEGMVT